MHVIEITGLTKTFGSHRVLDSLDLQVHRGEVLALLGPNGAGKTTLITILATLARPDGGTVRVADRDLVRQADEVRRVISLTGQHAAVDEMLSGAENLVLIGRLNGLTETAARQRADELLTAFDLVEAGHRRVRTYSGGMRRRLDLALGLVVEAQVIFLDEPTTGLDTRSRQALWEIVGRLARSGITVLLTTQYLEEADQLADRVAVLHRGRIVAEGTPAELKARVGEEVLEIRSADESVLVDRPVDGTPASVQRVLGELAPWAGPDTHVVLRRPTMDDVFLALTEEVAA